MYVSHPSAPHQLEPAHDTNALTELGVQKAEAEIPRICALRQLMPLIFRDRDQERAVVWL